MPGPDHDDLSRDHYEARLLKLYDEASHVVTQFWEWRHKVILLASTTLALVFAITSWMYNHGLGGVAMAFPLLAGGAMSFLFAKFDRRNGMIIEACYVSAVAHEAAMRERSPSNVMPFGVYEAIQDSRRTGAPYKPKPWTYGWVLRFAYLGLAAVLAALAVAAFLIGWLQSDWLVPVAAPEE